MQALVAQQSGQTIYTSVLTQPELISTLQRRVREGLLAALKAQRLAQQVLEPMTHAYALAAITPSVITQARAWLHRYPLRAYDALHHPRDDSAQAWQCGYLELAPWHGMLDSSLPSCNTRPAPGRLDRVSHAIHVIGIYT